MFAGINVHYIDDQWQAKTFLLELLEIHGGHSGVNVAEQVINVLDEYGITERVGLDARLIALVSSPIGLLFSS